MAFFLKYLSVLPLQPLCVPLLGSFWWIFILEHGLNHYIFPLYISFLQRLRSFLSMIKTEFMLCVLFFKTSRFVLREEMVGSSRYIMLKV